jgi:hypothetical protein
MPFMKQFLDSTRALKVFSLFPFLVLSRWIEVIQMLKGISAPKFPEKSKMQILPGVKELDSCKRIIFFFGEMYYVQLS